MRTVNRIITPILSLLIFPATIFLPLFRILISSGLLSGETKTNLLETFGLSEFISIHDLYTSYINSAEGSSNALSTIWSFFSEEKKAEIVDMLPGLHWGAFFLAFLVLVLICALVLAIVSAATKKPAASAVISVVGIISTLLMNTSFNAFAKPFLNGAFDLNQILGNTNQMLSLLLGNVASVEYMKLGIAYTAVILIFICTLILSITAVVEQKNED